MNGKKYRKIIITTVLFILGVIISKFNINLEGKIAEILQTIDNYSFLMAIVLIIGFLCSITYKRKGRYIKMLSELTLFAGAVVIAVRSLNGSIKLDTEAESLLNDGLLLSTVIGRIFLDKISKEDSENAQAESEIETKFGHKPIDKYVLLFENRKSQCDLVANIIKNKKIISDGYSICISGEWGCGKTSFIEAVLYKLKSGNQEKVDYSVIRINALELENINTLIEYYFNALKNIFDEKGEYSGFKSEYKEMLNSFIRIASHDSIANYVTNKIYPQSDYRNRIKDLDKLIKDVMKDERIIIVVDDIDRCSDKKAMEIIFFVKEIATRSNCVSFFLVEYNKLKESKIIKEFGDGFLEKFFNRVVAINKADYTEILKKFHDPGFEGNIYNVLDYYNHSIESAEETLNHNLKSENYKSFKEALERAKNDDKDIRSQLSNPRKLIKAHEHYELLKGIVKEESGKVEEKKNEYDLYLKKIDYQKQLVLISLLYGFHPDLYTHFECEGIEKIFGNESDKYSIDSILYNEWGYLGTAKFKLEKRMFAEYIVSEPSKIIDIINPYYSEFEQYTDYFDKGINLIDKGISFKQCIKELFENTGINGGEKYISKAFDLYKSTLSFDDALYVFQLYKSYFIRDYPLISLFYVYFCNENIKIESPSNCQEIFSKTYQEILVNLLNSFTSYLYFLDDGQGRYDGLTMLTHEADYCKKVEEGAMKVINEFGRVLEIKFKSNDVIDKMNEIIDCIDKKGKKEDKDFLNYDEIKDIRNISRQAIKEVESLMKIENYISYKNKPFSVDHSSSILEQAKRFRKAFESEDGYSFMDDDFNKFITSLCNSEDEINDELLHILDDTIKKKSKYNINRAFKYRKFYINLKKIKEARQNKEKELAVQTEKSDLK